MKIMITIMTTSPSYCSLSGRVSQTNINTESLGSQGLKLNRPLCEHQRLLRSLFLCYMFGILGTAGDPLPHSKHRSGRAGTAHGPEVTLLSVAA